MSRRSTWVFGAMAIVALAGCNQAAPGGGNATGSNSSATASTPGAAAPGAGGPGTSLTFADLPRPRAGLWQMTIDDGDGQPQTMTSCLSGAAPSFRVPPNCAKMNFTRDLTGAIIADIDCGDARAHVAEHFVTTGDMQNEMHSAGTMTISGMPGGPHTSNVRTDAKYMGACPAGMHPDDVNATG